MSGKRIFNPDMRTAFREQGNGGVHFMPLAATADWFKTSAAPTASVDGTSTTTLTSFTKSYAPLHPVCPVIVATDDAGSSSDWTAATAYVTGRDQFGNLITELVTGVDGGAGAWTLTCTKAFATLTRVVMTITGTVDGSDTYTIGFAKTYGLGVAIAADADVLIHCFNGSNDAGTVDEVNNTYLVAGTPDAAKWLDLYIKSTAID
jgi:hypothetical protein